MTSRGGGSIIGSRQKWGKFNSRRPLHQIVRWTWELASQWILQWSAATATVAATPRVHSSMTTAIGSDVGRGTANRTPHRYDVRRSAPTLSAAAHSCLRPRDDMGTWPTSGQQQFTAKLDTTPYILYYSNKVYTSFIPNIYIVYTVK